MKWRIFLYSRDRCVVRTVASVAGDLGCRAFGTGSLSGAIAFLRDNLHPADISIVDIGHYGVGFGMLDAIQEYHVELPCITVTESGAEYYQALALINGATDVFAKPLNAGELSHAVLRIREHGFWR